MSSDLDYRILFKEHNNKSVYIIGEDYSFVHTDLMKNKDWKLFVQAYQLEKYPQYEVCFLSKDSYTSFEELGCDDYDIVYEYKFGYIASRGELEQTDFLQTLGTPIKTYSI